MISTGILLPFSRNFIQRIDNSTADWYPLRTSLTGSRMENDFVLDCPRWKIASIVSDMPVERCKKDGLDADSPRSLVTYCKETWYCFLRQKYRGKCEKEAFLFLLFVVVLSCVRESASTMAKKYFLWTFNWHAFSCSQ